MSFSPRRPCANNKRRGNIPKIVWQFEWVQLGEVFDFTTFKKKNVWWNYVWMVSRGPVFGWGLRQGGGFVGRSRAESVYLWYLTCKEDATFAFYPISVSGDIEDDLAASTPSMWDSAFLITFILGHFFTRDSQTALWLWLGVSGSDCIASLAQSRVVLGRTQDPPSGPTTSSKAPHSQSMFVLVRGTQSSFQRNPSLKWNISTEAFVAPSDTNIQSSVNNHSLSYCRLNLNSSCNIVVSLSASFLPRSCFHFLSAPPWPCCLHFPPLSPHFSLDFQAVHQTD